MAATIPDPQLEQIFRAESQERLARLEEGLLGLEKAPADQALLEDLFREIHSLKGASRMLGLTAVEATTHALESLLNAARQDPAGLAGPGMEELDAGLGKLRGQIAQVLAPPTEASPGLPPAVAAPAPVPAPSTASAARPASAEAAPAFRIETVRVETAKLDDLLTLVGELGGLQGRGQHRLETVNRLLDQWPRLSPAGDARAGSWGQLLQAARDGLQEDAARFDTVLTGLQERVRTMRLLPLATVFGLFPRMVRDLGREEGKEVELEVEGDDLTLDKRLLEEIKDPLMHLLRNAVVHGIESPAERLGQGKPAAGRIRLAAARAGEQVRITVEDDGRGLDLEAIRRSARQRGLYDPETLAALPAAQLQQLVLAPGFSTLAEATELAGRGVGLDVVRSKVEGLKGGLRLDSTPGRGTAVILRLPLSLATLRLLVVEAAGQRFGLPLDGVHSLRRLPRDALYRLDGQVVAHLDGRPVPAPPLAELLERPGKAPAREEAGSIACVVLRVDDESLLLQVDEILAEEEVLPRPLGPPLRRVRNVASLAALADGEVCPVLNPADLLRSAAHQAVRSAQAAASPGVAPARRSILLAEDSALVRAMEKRIIEDAGYEVVTAVDGEDALAKLGSRDFAGVVSDIQMPNLDGLALTARIRQEARYRDLPVILVTGLDSEADKRRGLELGANAYIPKPAFDQRVLVETLRRLIGP